jgi:hypothetical protein
MAAAKPPSRSRKRATGVAPFAETIEEDETTEEEDTEEEVEEEETDDEEPDEEIVEEEDEDEELEPEEDEEEPEARASDFAPFIFQGEKTNWKLDDILQEVVDRGFAVIYDTTDEGLNAGVQWFKMTPVKVGEILVPTESEPSESES